MNTVQRLIEGKPSGLIHVLTSDPERKTNGMPFAATKCWLNMLGKGAFVIGTQPATCGTCTKV